MNTIELVNALKNNNVTKKHFKGVFPCDKLPQQVKKPACIIANTDPSYKSGTHWVAFYFPRKGPAEFYDSFGNYPFNIFFQAFLLRNAKSFINNRKRLQSPFSSTCGHYCCVYLYSRCKGKELWSFLKQFSSLNLKGNDAKIMDLYRKVYKRNSQRGGVYCNQICKAEIKI